jgi:hypothetical protein
MDLYAFKSHEEEIIKEIHQTAEKFNEILVNGYTSTEIKFPTGEILFSNFFKNSAGNDYAFDVPKDLKHKELYSINHAFGEQNCMDLLSKEHGLGYVQLGNTSVSIYKVNDDKIIMTSQWACYYDEEADTETDIPVPDGWELLGNVDCDVWRVEFIDKVNFDKGDVLPLDHKKYEYNEPFTGKVNPGIWTIKNTYHFMDDRVETRKGNIPVWVEMNRKV